MIFKETPLFLSGCWTSYPEVVCRKQLAKNEAIEWKEENNWDVKAVIESELYRSKQVKKMRKELTERFIRYVKKEARSDKNS